MPKAASNPKKVKTTKGKITSKKPTLTCACTGGCKGRMRQLSKEVYTKHVKFRELDEAAGKRNIDESVQPSISQSLASSVHLDQPDPPLLPNSSGSFAAEDVSDQATSQDHLPPLDSVVKESEESCDPDPGCLDLILSSQDDDPALEDSAPVLPSLECIFENTCLEDMLTTIKFIWVLQSATHGNPYCKLDQDAIQRIRNPLTAPFDISSLPDL